MIATISFSAIAEWVVGSFTAGMIVGFCLTAWLYVRLSRKKK